MGKLRVVAGAAIVAALVGVGLVFVMAWTMEKLAEDEAREDEPDDGDVVDFTDLHGTAVTLPGLRLVSSERKGA